jgi:uncharacterized protein involved in cysteine biosynthesis
LPAASLPAVVNLLVFVLVLAFLGPHASAFVASRLPHSGLGYYLLVVPTLVILWLLVFLICILLVNLLGNVIAGPFNDALSAQVERIEGRLPEERFEFAKVITRFGTSIGIELKKWGLYLLALLALAPLHLVPIAGSVLWTGLGGLLSFWFLGFEYLDYCFSRRNFTFADRRRFCFDRCAETIGQGIAIALTLLVPPFTLLMMPLSVVGSTLLFLDLEKETQAGSTPAPGR